MKTVSKNSSITGKKIQVSCKTAGILTIPNEYTKSGDFSTSGNLADYTLASAEELHSVASRYDFIRNNPRIPYHPVSGLPGRPEYNKVKGSSYTLAMAKRDFEKYAQ